MGYPEHEKLAEVRQSSEDIGKFLEWLDSEGLILAKEAEGSDHFWPAHVTITKLLARYFEIDLKKLDAEKDEMLRRFRNGSKKATTANTAEGDHRGGVSGGAGVQQGVEEGVAGGAG